VVVEDRAAAERLLVDPSVIPKRHGSFIPIVEEVMHH
jgi:hypothetical protein